MARISRLILIFSVLFTLFINGLPFLSRQFGPFQLMKTQDAVDLLTPLVLIPIYWLLFRLEPARPPTRPEILAFILLAVLWVEGQAIHLAANSIGHYAESYAGTEIQRLTGFYDETLGHYLWHAGIVGLSLLLLYRQWRNPFEDSSSPLRTEIGAGLLHGLSYALIVLEGVTVPLGLPAALLVVGFTLARGRGRLRQEPVLAFFFVAYLAATVFMLAWRLYWGCFVEPLNAIKHLGSPLC